MRHAQKGSVMVEIALGSVVFFALTIGIFDLGRMYHYQARLKFAVSQATRFATTGNTLEDSGNPGTQLSRADSIIYMIRELSGFDIPSADIEISAITGSGATVAGAGSPGDVVVVTATHRVNVITPFLSSMFEEGQFEFHATTSFRNEEFPDSASAAPLSAATEWA
jgi:hypothetical protein